jgi:hypothetical protein
MSVTVTKIKLMDKFLDYESGSMCETETIDFFQALIDSGVVWKLQGSYGRTAKRLIEAGRCTKSEATDA